jgi:uncharacterized protein YciU (UPF0263 family)
MLTSFIELFNDIVEFKRKKMAKKVKKVKTKENVFIELTYRRLDPAQVLMSETQYLNRIVELLLSFEYETAEKSITLIEKLPILNHEKSTVFI